MRRVGLAIGVIALLFAVPACSRPAPVPERDVPTTEISPAPPSRSAPAVGPSAKPIAGATACGGKPTTEQIVALMRGQGVAPEVKLSVAQGPTCVGTWQYSIVHGEGLDPVQVVSRYEGDKLVFVVAGTSICDAPGLTSAPAGLKTAAGC